MNNFFPIFILVFAISCKHDGKNDIAKNTTGSSDSTRLAYANIRDKNYPLNQECTYDNEVSSLGIGIIITPGKFQIFNDDKLTSEFADIDMYAGKTGDGICSKFFKPDYGIMHFVVLENSKDAYKVLSSYSSEKYLPAMLPHRSNPSYSTRVEPSE